MAKKKKGKKGKAKEEESGGEKKAKRTTEKELFERQIEEMRIRLESSNLDLERTRARLERARQSLHSEQDGASACAEHLKRALRSESDRRLRRQERLLAERDMWALVERRALGKFAVSERNGGVAKSLFLQQKTELEGKLSLLEELRLARNSQLSRLQRAEEFLRERTATLRQRTRAEESDRVRQLLEDREAFLRMCRDVGSERREAFGLQIRVHAERQLQENVRLRRICERRTERLLGEQERIRGLKRAQKSMELEEETLLLAERDATRRQAHLEKRRRRLIEAYPDLRAAVAKESRLQAEVGISQEAEQETEQSSTEDRAKINHVLAKSRVSLEVEEAMSKKTEQRSAEDSAKMDDISDEPRVSFDARERMSQRTEQSPTDDRAMKINHVLAKSRVPSEVDEEMSQKTEQRSAEDSTKMDGILDEPRVSSEASERMSKKIEQYSAEDRTKINHTLAESQVSSEVDEEMSKMEQHSAEDSGKMDDILAEPRVSFDACERMSQKTEHYSTEDKTKINHASAESHVSSEVDEEMSKIEQHSAEDSTKMDGILDEPRVSSEASDRMSKKIEQHSAEDSAKMDDILDEPRVSSEASERMSQKARHSSTADNAIGSRGAAIRRRIESIRERELQQCHLEDRRREMSAILRDQAEYRTSLEDELGQNIDRNGERMSAVLRAGRILQARCGKLEREGMDFDLLHQIRMILDG